MQLRYVFYLDWWCCATWIWARWGLHEVEVVGEGGTMVLANAGGGHAAVLEDGDGVVKDFGEGKPEGCRNLTSGQNGSFTQVSSAISKVGSDNSSYHNVC